MVEIKIPDFGHLKIEHVVMDFNGTLATKGVLVEGVRERLIHLSESVQLHVITADTFGRAKDELVGCPVTLEILPESRQAVAKAAYIKRLGPKQVVTLGNGRNDRLFLETSALGIGVILTEGIALETFRAADVLCVSILDALDLLIEPERLLATLRS